MCNLAAGSHEYARCPLVAIFLSLAFDPMRSLLSVFVLALVLTGCENVQAPAELTLQTRDALDVLPAGVQTAGMIDLDHARASDAFAILNDGGFSMTNAGGEHAARFDDFVAATGFDPDEDLHRVYFGLSEDLAGEATPHYVVYADYDRARLDAYIERQDDLQLERSDYADAPVYVTSKNGHEMAFALVNDDMIVASSRAGVYAMLDRISSGGQGLGGDAEMMALIRQAGHPDDAWAAVRNLSEHALPAANDDHAAFGQASRMMDDVVMSVAFEDDGLEIHAVGVPRAGTDPADVADLVRGSVSAMKMNVDSGDALFDVLDRARVEERRDGVEVRAFLTDAALRAMRAQGDA